MKYQRLTFLILFIASCKQNENHTNRSVLSKCDAIIKHDTVCIHDHDDWQNGFGLTHEPDKDSVWGKPVKS